MISLKRIVEQHGSESQYYDLGKDFSNFRRMIDGSFEEVKRRFESTIGAKLNGKRIRARASRGYKQFVKDYEFDVSKITIDDYYDNYVIVATDTNTSKPKEYFLKPGFKVQVLGPATGQPSPQKGGDPNLIKPPTPQHSPTEAQSEPMAPMKLKEDEKSKPVDAYSIEDIIQDIEKWLPKLLVKPETSMRDFVKAIGWKKDNVAMFDIKLPVNFLKYKISEQSFAEFLAKLPKTEGKLTVNSMNLNDTKDEWNIRIRKDIY